MSADKSDGAYSCRTPPADWISTRETPKWLQQHPVEPQLAGLAELLNANNHPFMAGGGLIAIGAEQAIPPRQVEAEIAVGLIHDDRVMHAMHFRRDYQPSQIAIDTGGNTDIAMVE